MGDVTRLITLGIGPGSTIDGLILVGLNVGPVVAVARSIPGCVGVGDALLGGVSLADALVGGVSLADALFGMVVVGEAGCETVNIPVELEDLSGSWQFEDGSEMEWL